MSDPKVDKPAEPYPGMMGDGTEEQNLNQPGNPAARITEADVEDAFKDAPQEENKKKR
jgi:hypothetical protein